MSERDGGIDPALTHDDVIHLVGDVEDVVVTAILATGALYGEIEEAQKRAAGDAADLAKQGRTLSPAAEAVYDILTSDPAFLDPDTERQRGR